MIPLHVFTGLRATGTYAARGRADVRQRLTLGELARMVGGDLAGDPQLCISGVSPFETADAGDITFAENTGKARAAVRGGASAVVVPRGADLEGKPGIIVDNPRLAFAKILAMFQPEAGVAEGIDERAAIDETAAIGSGARIGPNVTVEAHAAIGDNVVLYPGVYIGRGARVGDGTVVYPGVVIREQVVIGKNVIIHAGAVIGADGFGYVECDEVHHKIPQIGTVIIEDDVEIGANSCVDRATMGATVIGRGTKIDNQVQIGHNVKVGENCIIVGQAGVGGSSEIGSRSTLAGGAGVKDHVTIGPGSIVAAKAVVCTNVPPDAFVSGCPARPHKEQLAIEAAMRKLPELVAQVRRLQERVAELEKEH